MLAELANTGMAVTSDVGHRTDVHPKEKRVVGERLARWALADVYGKDLVRSGPLFASLVCDGERARVRFEHGTGLRAASGELIGFEVRAAEGAFVPATASTNPTTLAMLFIRLNFSLSSSARDWY